MPRGKGIYDDKDATSPRVDVRGRRMRVAKAAWRHARDTPDVDETSEEPTA